MAAAADTGGGIAGDMIDLGFPDGVSVDWSTRWVDVFVLAPGLGFIIRIASGTGISSTGIGSVDFTLILGVAIVSAVLYVGANFAVDLLQAYYDRRILG